MSIYIYREREIYIYICIYAYDNSIINTNNKNNDKGDPHALETGCPK